jgi:uncharacterized protein YecT (DUF1311 family)
MIALITALLLSAQEPDVNCRDPQTQTEMTICARQDFERADAELNAVYRTAIASAQAADREWAEIQRNGGGGRGDEPGEEASLREAQRAWLSFRQAHCRLESYEARGGTMEPMLYGMCMANVTRARAAELRGPKCPGDGEQAEINACLDRIFTRADAALNRQWQETLTARAASAEQLRTAQRAWLAYRDAHCEIAIPSVASAEIQTSERLLCRTRLTEARTHELAGLAAMGE